MKEKLCLIAEEAGADDFRIKLDVCIKNGNTAAGIVTWFIVSTAQKFKDKGVIKSETEFLENVAKSALLRITLKKAFAEGNYDKALEGLKNDLFSEGGETEA